MSNSPIEIISAREWRWRWSVEEKLRIVAETHEPGGSMRAVAARHDVYPNPRHSPEKRHPVRVRCGGDTGDHWPVGWHDTRGDPSPLWPNRRGLRYGAPANAASHGVSRSSPVVVMTSPHHPPSALATLLNAWKQNSSSYLPRRCETPCGRRAGRGTALARRYGPFLETRQRQMRAGPPAPTPYDLGNRPGTGSEPDGPNTRSFYENRCTSDRVD